jgi:hypothetical protein
MDEKLNEIRERLDRVDGGKNEIGNLIIAMSILVDLVEEIMKENERSQTAVQYHLEKAG